MPSQLALFEESNGPKGLFYRPGFIPREAERELILRIAELPLTQFQFGAFEGKRRVISFGHRYDFSTHRLEEAEPLPAWILPTVAAIEKSENLAVGAISHVLFTEYAPGTGIGWHRDKKEFAEVFGLSLGSACNFRFRRRNGQAWDRFTLRVEPCSLYAITGEARHLWEHSIPPVEKIRYSVTFRTLRG